MKRPARVPSQLSESLHKRVNAYALAASAAGVGALAFAQSAEAKIVYTPAHHIIKPNSKYNLDLDKDGVIDFVITDSLHCGSGSYCAVLGIGERKGASWAAEALGVGPNTPLALRKGAKIGANQDWSGTSSGGGTMANDRFLTGGTFSSQGNWASVTNRYLGLRIVVNHAWHYGWARMTVKIDSKTGAITAILTGYAYETTANKGLIAGRTKGPEEAAPETGTLGALARGTR